MNKKHESHTNEHFTDEPIERREQDRLRRRSFAEALAQHLHRVPLERGFAIAVLGEWGSGKTSVLNMVSEILAKSESDIAILRLNPWLFRGSADLVTLFFSELSVQLGQQSSERLKRVGKAVLNLGLPMAASLLPVPGIGAATNVSDYLVDSWLRPTSLDEKREEIKETLKAAGSRIVVIIDDIDRLEPTETRDIMRLVRLTSDLPNLIFLLAFDGHRVSQSLGADEGEEEGKRYLEKIVQECSTLPLIPRYVLANLLTEYLNQLMETRSPVQLDGRHWGSIRANIIEPLIGNLRDVKRYVNSLAVTLDFIGEEVALEDVLGLEAVRVLQPSVFEDLRMHAEDLTAITSNSGGRREQIKKELCSILKRSKDRRLVESIFAILFPSTQEFLGNRVYGSHWTSAWRKQKRVACKEIFRIYLQAGLGVGDIPSSTITELLHALTDEEKLIHLLDNLGGENDFLKTIRRLEDFEQDISEAAISIAVPAFANKMEHLSSQSYGGFELPPNDEIKAFISRLFAKAQGSPELADLISETLVKVSSLSGQFHVIETALLGRRPRLQGPQEGQIKRGFVSRLEKMTAKELAQEWDLSILLMRTLNWLKPSEQALLSTRLRKHLSDDGFVLTLLRTALGHKTTIHFDIGDSFSGHDISYKEKLYWEELISVFGDELKDAVARLAKLSSCDTFSEEEQAIINLANEYAREERSTDLERV